MMGSLVKSTAHLEKHPKYTTLYLHYFKSSYEIGSIFHYKTCSLQKACKLYKSMQRRTTHDSIIPV